MSPNAVSALIKWNHLQRVGVPTSPSPTIEPFLWKVKLCPPTRVAKAQEAQKSFKIKPHVFNKHFHLLTLNIDGWYALRMKFATEVWFMPSLAFQHVWKLPSPSTMPKNVLTTGTVLVSAVNHLYKYFIFTLMWILSEFFQKVGYGCQSRQVHTHKRSHTHTCPWHQYKILLIHTFVYHHLAGVGPDVKTGILISKCWQMEPPLLWPQKAVSNLSTNHINSF